MKKNSINCFENKKTLVDKITGGYYWQETSSDGGQSWSDEQLVTERGEEQPGGAVSYRSEYYDSDIKPCGLAIP